jgi:hypothetical protein
MLYFNYPEAAKSLYYEPGNIWGLSVLPLPALLLLAISMCLGVYVFLMLFFREKKKTNE